MAAFNFEQYESYLQLLQLGQFTLPVQETYENLIKDFHRYYEDFLVEDPQNRTVTPEQFNVASRLYFQLGHALQMNLIIGNAPLASEMEKSDQSANNSASKSQSQGEPAKLSDEQQRAMEDVRMRDQDRAWEMDQEQESPLPKVPYAKLYQNLRPILDIPIYTVVNEELIYDLNARVHMVKARVFQSGMLWDTVEKYVIAIVESKLDIQSRMMWNWDLADLSCEPTIENLSAFLMKRTKRITPEENRQAGNAKPYPIIDNEMTNETTCAYCRGPHKMCRCEAFRAIPKRERWVVVNSIYVCENCFSKNHLPKHCPEGPCKKCKVPHNSLLCGKSQA